VTRKLGPLSLHLAAGECAALAGPSGAGKTLLLRAIADLDPHRGEVYLDGREASQVSPEKWRRAVGMLPAESVWWYDMVGAHFPTASPSSLEVLGFDDDVLGWTVRRLSTGERARLGLARLLCNRLDVLLLDEPTASLDPVSTQRVEAVLAAYRSGQKAALLWVSHDPEQVERVAGRCWRLDGGKHDQTETRPVLVAS
jgi:ABC-type iron transport system FetAB ATPase subunit